MIIASTQNILEGRLLSLSLHPTGNYVVQKLLSSCENDKDSRADFDSWFESELDAGVEDILAAGNTGVVLAVAQACRRLATKQHHFMGVSLGGSPHLILLIAFRKVSQSFITKLRYY